MKKICLAGGGTGGHITPLVSLFKSIKQKDFQFFWIGENDSLEQKIATENNINFYGIKAGKLRRYFSLKTIIEPFMIIIGIIQAYKILRNEKPDLVFSKGGYVSLPIAIASKIVGIKIFLHESDTVPGLANRLVGKFAEKIFLGFAEANKFFANNKTSTTGQLLNPELFLSNNKNQNYQEIKINKTELLVIAGSQGSTRIFETIEKNINLLNNFNITIILGTLNIHFKEKFEKFENIKTLNFITQKELGEIYKKTDIAITRAGATSLAELQAFGIKMIIVPLKESANNHQYYNALSYEKSGNTLVEDDFLNEKLIQEILKLENYKKDTDQKIENNGINKIIEQIGL